MLDNLMILYYTTLCNRGVAQFGRALRSGRRGRKFESCRLDFTACWSSGQDDALSRRKPGFDSRTGHEAVWNFHTASFFMFIIVFINRKL